MEQSTILYGGVEALYTMKENLLELEGYKVKSSELALKEDQIEKQIEYKEKALSEEIGIATKKRRLEIEASFDEQIDKVKARIKKVKTKKAKEKSNQISGRIKLETVDLTAEKVRLKEEMKAVYQANHIPRILNNSLYYALFLPRSFKDICTILLTIIITLFVLPYLVIYKILLPEDTLNLVIVYIFAVVIFGGLYLLINVKTKEQHSNAVIDMRAIRAKQAKNQKRIDAIVKEIRKDKDESSYGLKSFTDEIEGLEQELRLITEEKKEAVIEFETNTKSVIDEEIRADKKDELDTLKAAHLHVYDEQKKIEEKVKLFSIEITNQFEKYVGKEMLSIGIIDSLIQIMQESQVSTVAEAIAIYKKQVQ